MGTLEQLLLAVSISSWVHFSLTSFTYLSAVQSKTGKIIPLLVIGVHNFDGALISALFPGAHSSGLCCTKQQQFMGDEVGVNEPGRQEIGASKEGPKKELEENLQSWIEALICMEFWGCKNKRNKYNLSYYLGSIPSR